MALKWFRKLDEAIRFAETASELCIFSQEFASNGARKFVAGLLPDLWDLLINTSSTERTFYEIVQDTKWCRYYLDVEMLTEFNPRANLEAIVKQIVLIHEKKYGKYKCIVLDSSSSIKSSFHVIWPNQIFATKSELKSEVMDAYGSCLDVNVHNKHGNMVSCIDFSVYSKRQNFRTYLSVKKGKNVPLQKHSFTSACLMVLTEYAFFASSLICVPNIISTHHVNEARHLDQSRFLPVIHHPDINQYPELLDVQKTMRTLHNRLNQLTLSSFAYYTDSNILVVRSKNQQYCLTANRPHSTNNIYFVHFISSPAIQQRCQNGTCKLASALYGWPLLHVSTELKISLQKLTIISRSSVSSFLAESMRMFEIIRP